MKALNVKSFRLGVIKFQSFLFFTLLLNGCIDPVAPEFDFNGGLIFVDAFASNIPISCFVTIEKSDTQFGFSYPCEVPCWRIRYNEEVSLFKDEFTNGKSIQDLSVAILTLYTKENTLVFVEQLSLTPKAYKYYKNIKGHSG
ncbi:hypothetical protein [Maribacter cobaltidurans]|uniref:Uncharacterized protein n=1 Tax=Maribacter cobaltidurans TaxID=1178778 RepID=A0A223V2L6_9FLAO|nr:hypothetical protein [Maribacter cobaltidurans]ASV29516.1 hypothetical protein CJ263_04360 [Maribacter cobaltidurans]GGD68367.1 hypothetical protein GCM10011412_02440 [Maribacter cobaltidurans]